jgi:group II intron reverse transcriptase/maturase
MSNPNFLIACWVNIRSKEGRTALALSADTLDGIKTEWFYETSKSFRNGNFNFKPTRRTDIPKPNGKLRPLTIPSTKDKIVQEGMRFLLETIFEPTFRDSSHGFRPNRGCDSALNNIKIKFGETKWFIEGDVNQQFPKINHNILIKLIEQRIKDQPFIDLIWKYLRTGYGESVKSIKPMDIGVVQGGNLSPILSNIYMHPFDVWMEDHLIPSFTKGKYRTKNPEYLRINRGYTDFGTVMAKHNLRSVLWNDPNFKRIKYVRYVDDFLVGVIGSKNDCIELRLKMKEFLENELKMVLNLDKTKITHSSQDSALFLGYNIHITKFLRIPIKYNKQGKLIRVNPRLQLDGPIDRIVKRLRERGFANKLNNPTRNGNFIALSLADLVNHYKTIERGILNYYGFASNYGRVAARVHYILKYSCALTIASKMKLGTLRRVFSKYGRNINIKDENGKIITNYPPVSYKRPNTMSVEKNLSYDNIIDKLTYRLGRGRSNLKRTLPHMQIYQSY